MHLSCFQAYLIKSGFLILMQVNYIAVEIRQHSSDKSNTCTTEAEHQKEPQITKIPILPVQFTSNISQQLFSTKQKYDVVLALNNLVRSSRYFLQHIVLLASWFPITVIRYQAHKLTCIYCTGKTKQNKTNLQQNCGLCFIYLYIWGNFSHDIENKMLTFNIADICEFQPDTNTGERLRFQNDRAYMQHIMHIMAQLAIRAESTGESCISGIYLHRSQKYFLLAMKQLNFRTPNNTVLRKYYGRLLQRN